MPFRYQMTDTSKERLQQRIEEAESRGFRQYAEIKQMGHHTMVQYTKLDKFKRNHQMETTAGKFGVVMERVAN